MNKYKVLIIQNEKEQEYEIEAKASSKAGIMGIENFMAEHDIKETDAADGLKIFVIKKEKETLCNCMAACPAEDGYCDNCNCRLRLKCGLKGNAMNNTEEIRLLVEKAHNNIDMDALVSEGLNETDLERYYELSEILTMEEFINKGD